MRPSYLYLALSFVILPALALSISCSGARSMSGPGSNPAHSTVPQFGHVVLVVEENHSYSSVIGSSAMPYLNSLARRYSLATNYYANIHQSIGNYFMLTTGQIVTVDDSFNGTVNVDNLVRKLLAAGKTWKSYAESLPSVGYTEEISSPTSSTMTPSPISAMCEVTAPSCKTWCLLPNLPPI
jgi:acid phosphatase